MDKDHKPIEAAHWFSNRQVVGLLSAAIVATFYVTVNYTAFERLTTDQETDIEALRQEFKKEIAVILAQEEKDETIENNRFLTIERRLEKKIEKLNILEKEINRLKQKGSDKE